MTRRLGLFYRTRKATGRLGLGHLNHGGPDLFAPLQGLLAGCIRGRAISLSCALLRLPRAPMRFCPARAVRSSARARARRIASSSTGPRGSNIESHSLGIQSCLLRRYDWTLQTYITVSNTSPSRKVLGSLGIDFGQLQNPEILMQGHPTSVVVRVYRGLLGRRSS